MTEWQPIETAPKDGTAIRAKRVHDGRVICDGIAAWRTVHFGELRDPISGEQFAAPEDATGWMCPKGVADKRFPTPTHWMPLPEPPEVTAHSPDTYKTYICSYRFDDGTWSFEIKARSFEEARERVKAMVWATVDGASPAAD